MKVGEAFNRKWIVGGCLVGVAVLSGCATDADLAESDISVPAAYRNAEASRPVPPRPVLPRPSAEWWREFGNEELDRLVEYALAGNRDLGVAIARVAQAEAQAGVTDAVRYPTLDGVAKAQVEGPSGGVGSSDTRADWDTQRLYQIGLRANWEVDLWGKAGYAADSAFALAIASVHHRESVALTLIADVAATYFEILSLSDRIGIARRNLANSRNALAAVTRRVEKGDATMIEQLQQRTAESIAAAAIPPLQLRRERAFNRLAFLVGKAPVELHVVGEGLEGVGVPEVVTDLPSDLLCRRPDIRRAEAQLMSAQADVRSARASFLPTFSLTGEAGYGSYYLSKLLDPASLFMSAVGTVVQSIFDADKKENQLKLQKARNVEMVEQYAGAVLAALRDVEDALAAVRLTEEQRQALDEAVDRAGRAYDLSRRSYDRGGVDFITLLDTERTLYQNEDAESAAKFERLRSAIDLYKALGGGMAEQGGDPCAK